MGIFSGYLICSDLDGTFLDPSGHLVEKNLEALRGYIAEGGLFTLSTGRTEEYIRERYEGTVPINTHIVSHNGTALYDETGALLFEHALDKDALNLFLKTETAYLDVREMRIVTDRATRTAFSEIEEDEHVRKVVFVYEKEADCLAAEEHFMKAYAGCFDFGRSWPTGLELIDAGAGKGEAVLKLKALTGAHTLVCVGDYENDISMMKAADIGYAVKNAVAATREASDRQTVACADGAIAAVIDELRDSPDCLCRWLGFSEEDVASVRRIERAASCASSLLGEAREEYLFSETNGYEAKLAEAATATELLRQEVNLIFELSCLPYMRNLYRERELPETVLYETARDILYKAGVCKKRFGICGLTEVFWHRRFFKGNLFGIGRLQYEIIPIEHDFPPYAKTGDPVYNIHIPENGGLTEEAINASFAEAKAFFGVTGDMVVMCRSWLLYPPLYPMFPEGSNLQKFYERFTILESHETDNGEMYRIFDKTTDDFSSLPDKNRLQHNMIGYLKDGHIMGKGTGVLIV